MKIESCSCCPTILSKWETLTVAQVSSLRLCLLFDNCFRSVVGSDCWWWRHQATGSRARRPEVVFAARRACAVETWRRRCNVCRTTGRRRHLYTSHVICRCDLRIYLFHYFYYKYTIHYEGVIKTRKQKRNYSNQPFDAHRCHTAIEHHVPDRVKPSFVIFDIRALWR